MGICDTINSIKDQISLKVRKELKCFNIGGLYFKLAAIEKYNLVVAFGYTKIIAVDYEALVMKSEIKYDFGKNVSPFCICQFSDINDILDLRTNSYLTNEHFELKFKASANGIALISANKQKIPNYPRPNNFLEYLSYYENGSAIMFTKGKFESSNEKLLAYVDSYGRVLSSCEVPKEIQYESIWDDQNYAVFSSYTAESDWDIQKKAADTLYIYRLKDMHKVAEIVVKRSGWNHQVCDIHVTPANDKTLLITFFAEIHILDLESGTIVNKITFCNKEKKFVKIIKQPDDTFWAMGDEGKGMDRTLAHLHQFKLDGTKLSKSQGHGHWLFVILKGGRKVAVLPEDYDMKLGHCDGRLVIESNEEEATKAA